MKTTRKVLTIPEKIHQHREAARCRHVILQAWLAANKEDARYTAVTAMVKKIQTFNDKQDLEGDESRETTPEKSEISTWLVNLIAVEFKIIIDVLKENGEKVKFNFDFAPLNSALADTIKEIICLQDSMHRAQMIDDKIKEDVNSKASAFHDQCVKKISDVMEDMQIDSDSVPIQAIKTLSNVLQTQFRQLQLLNPAYADQRYRNTHPIFDYLSAVEKSPHQPTLYSGVAEDTTALRDVAEALQQQVVAPIRTASRSSSSSRGKCSIL